MSRDGDCRDHAMVERLHRMRVSSRRHAKGEVIAWLGFY
jgi:hypothetical protein